MSAAQDLLHRLSEIGATVNPAGDKLVVRAGMRPIPGELIRTMRDRKAELLAAFAEAADWRDRHREALAHWSVLHPAEAEAIAWGEMVNRWHRLHGERVPVSQCGGCGDAIDARPMLELADKARVHFETFDCLIAYSTRWRGAAVGGLQALGLQPPEDFDLL